MIYPVIDSHCHFWDLSLGYHGWISDRESEFLGNLRPINHSYLKENYLNDSKNIKIEKIILIEAASTRFAKNEVEWIEKQYSKDSLLGGIVAGADLLDKNIEKLLAYYGSNPFVKGIRQLLNWSQQSKYTAADRRDDLLNSQWQKNYHLLKQYSLSFDMQIIPEQMQDAFNLAKSYPDISIILNHAGMPILEYLDTWKSGVAALSTCENVSVKLSGFGMMDHHLNPDRIRFYVSHLIDYFGIDRCMFASNFPVDKLYTHYEGTLGAYINIIESLSFHEKSAFFYENAKRIYRAV